MATRQQSAREFVKTWSSPNKGREDADRQTFWNDLLQRVYGINDYYNYITYEKDVQVKAGGKVTTRRIDGYIPSTKVMIEMKGKKVKDLTKPLKQSGGVATSRLLNKPSAMLTSYLTVSNLVGY
ncbi:type IIL restriction-modification enzyme MmeI [Limosilactobacillus vaginalis]|uniref:type IIL restriction-modification enzyme MmeI n=1 Tax=Limosilactobacillus vaginalis TaxID=1633 RepID=UPI0025A34111|nr:type IIL restriction-modification enzyme MmeI [Limosilactobacillus vaginalis]MDM8222170.1 hypothetical protein [Limosilactobacillus vaginalis]